MVQAGVYAGLMHLFQGAGTRSAANPHDGIKVVDQMKVDADRRSRCFGKGPDPAQRPHHSRPPYLYEVKKARRVPRAAVGFLQSWSARLRGDQAFTPLDKSTCALLKK